MSEHFHEVYAGQAEAYHRLVMAEDFENNLLREIRMRCPIVDADVIEAGAGTGRITRWLLDAGARSVVAVEPSAAMRGVALRYLDDVRGRCQLIEGVVEALPVESNAYDLAIAGWVVGHFADWYPDTWRTHVDNAVTEMKRALRPEGTLMLIESLGTGSETPCAPTPQHASYYRHLEEYHGMHFKPVRTDYGFDNVDAAVEVMGFFFGEDLCKQIQLREWCVVPECTGVWSTCV